MKVSCPSCDAILNAPDESVGKKAKCNKCNGVFEIDESDIIVALDPVVTPAALEEKPSWFAKGAAAILLPIYYVWFVGVFVSIPYYNWQYARTNGFVAWAVFGEVVPTLQGFIWPFYVARHFISPPLTDDERKQFQHFKDSLAAFSAFSESSESLSDGKIGTKAAVMTELASMLQNLRKSRDEADKVSDKLLAKFNPDMPSQFSSFKKGVALYQQAIEGSINQGSRSQQDADNEKAAIALIRGFQEWMMTLPKDVFNK